MLRSIIALTSAFSVALGVAAAAGERFLPDQPTTPGGLNPMVTQDNIGSTICRRGWTRTIRPAEAYTERLKRDQLYTPASPYFVPGERLGAFEGVGLRVLSGGIDTTSAAGRLVFGIFASLAEFEADLIRERTLAGLAAARARGRVGGRRRKLTPANLAFARRLLDDPSASTAQRSIARLALHPATGFATASPAETLESRRPRLNDRFSDGRSR